MKSIGVIIVTYYRNEQLAAAIESALASKDVSVSVYVVDMSCERHAKPVADRYDVHYVPVLSYETEDTIEQIAKAREIGIRVSNEEYISFLDDDDTIVEDGLYKMSERVDETCGVAFGIMDSLLAREIISPFYAAENPVDTDEVRAFILSKLSTPFSISAMVVRRDVIEAVPNIWELPHDDIATVLELTMETEIASLDEVVMEAQQEEHGASLSKESIDGQADIFPEYEGLYDELPAERVPISEQKDAARAEHYRYKGMAELTEKNWSFAAIRYYYRSARTQPRTSVWTYLQLLSTLFGTWGLSLYQKLYVKAIS